jgi:hypothetical protein
MSTQNTINTEQLKNDIADNKSPKKRGRPKKIISQVKQKPKKSFEFVENNDENYSNEKIVLRIPNFDEDVCSTSDKNIFTMLEDTEDNNINTSFKIIDSFSELSDEENENENENKNIKELLIELKRKDIIINKLKNKFHLNHDNDLDEKQNDNFIHFNTNKSFIDLKLINIHNNNEIKITDKTNICCWWCCHEFDTIPCFLPDRYVDNKFYVFGCFCSYECVMAYNMNMNDYKMQLRNSLIKELHHRIFKTTEKIYIARPKEILQKFGGPMTIELYRNKALLCKKEHKIDIPPLISLVSTVEEIYRDPSQNPKNVYKNTNKK